VIDPQTQALLQDIVGRESRSVLLYVHDAFPWTTAAEGETLLTLRRLIATEARAVAALGQYLVRRHLPPPLPGSYPSSYTTINFLALDYLLPRLADAAQRALADLERDLDSIADAEARTEVEKLAAVKRRNLAVLEELAAPHRRAPHAGAGAAVPQTAGA
jgi:hypothetical protein